MKTAAIWGSQIPYNTGGLKKDAMNIIGKPMIFCSLGWIKDVFGTGIAKDSGNLDTYSYKTWIARGNESERFDDVPVLIPFLADGADTAVIIAPEGAFCYKSYDSEGSEIAKALNKKGISAFVLNYRLNPYKAPVCYLDMQRAIRYVRYHAAEYGLNPHKIGSMGFSAGGYVAGAAAILLGDHPVEYPGYIPDEVDKINGKADFLGMVYPVTGFNKNPNMLCLLAGNDFFHDTCRPALQKKYDLAEHVSKECAPQFLCYGTKDKLQDMIGYDHKLDEVGASHKSVVVKGAGHGFSTDKKYACWLEAYVEWIRETV